MVYLIFHCQDCGRKKGFKIERIKEDLRMSGGIT